MMSLFIASHYKNSPNDLQLMSDAPAHLLFVLLGPMVSNSDGKNQIPDILCVVQVALEGNISSNSIIKQRGMKPSGDLIPWTISEQYQDNQFPRLNGARVVRIASHPATQKMGYGSKALEILTKFFEGNLINLGQEDGKLLIDLGKLNGNKKNEGEVDDNLKPRKKLEPILKKLVEIKPPLLHYLGVSYGLTKELFNFWRKNSFYPVYLRQSKNDVTAEHSCIMLKKLIEDPIEGEDILNNEWLNGYYEDFKRRFLSLLAYEFKEIDITLSLGVLEPNLTQNSNDDGLDFEEKDSISKEELNVWLNLYDLKRLEAYSKNMVDFHLIIDLLPSLARLFFSKKFTRTLKFSYSQAAILMGMGLQHKNVEQIAREINLPVAQVLALFNKAIRKMTNHIKTIYEKEIELTLKKKKDSASEVFFLIKKYSFINFFIRNFNSFH